MYEGSAVPCQTPREDIRMQIDSFHDRRGKKQRERNEGAINSWELGMCSIEIVDSERSETHTLGFWVRLGRHLSFYFRRQIGYREKNEGAVTLVQSILSVK